jgi:hypothetical protein
MVIGPAISRQSLAQANIFWCRFLDDKGGIVSAEKIQAINDETALAKAREIAANQSTAILELWDGKRLVGREVTQQPVL